MKKIIALLLSSLSILSFAQNATEKGIHFEHGTFAQLLEKAKKENKPIMIDAYTTWCGPCKLMSKTTFMNDTAAEFYNRNFVSAKIDMEKGEGLEIAKKYNVKCYPTFLFLDGNGELIHRQSAYMQTQEFIGLGKDAMLPNKQFAGFKKKYTSGKATRDEIAAYLLMCIHSCISDTAEFEKYFASEKEADFMNQRNWNLISENYLYIRFESKPFQYLVDHKDDFSKAYGKDNVEKVIHDVYYYAILNYAAKKAQHPRYQKMKEELIRRNFTYSGELVASADMNYYRSLKDWTKYGEACEKYITAYQKDNANTLNEIAWTMYENVADKGLLEKAATWSKHSIELAPEYANWDTYCAVLYKLEKYSEAKEAAAKAIELAKTSGEDYSSTQELLDKINAVK